MGRSVVRNGIIYSIDNNNATVLGLKKKDIEYLVIPDEVEGYPVEYIMPKAFKDNFSLITVSLPGAIKHITNAVFYRCSKLQKIEFRGIANDLVLHYYSIAFCHNLKEIESKRKITCESSAIVCCENLNNLY